MSKFETNDEFMCGAIAGALSALLICLLMELLEVLGLIKHCWLFMAGNAVLHYEHGNIFHVVFGLLLHLGIGAFWGVIIAILFSKVFTEKHYLLKSLVVSTAIFFLHLGLLAKALNYPAKLRKDAVAMFFIFVSYLLYGGLTVYLLKKLSCQRSNDHDEAA
ncbi:MAG TPA: hypothetical protein GX391_07805 [Firmicutes bacterium]|jgi:hypothetical protein|nr:hypothetical protein [Bacillota bacterium]HOQ23414.1 hypothetical protein [Bacillota bacterium]HPT66832.1 hypothetical protein [Bacillota bacterium]